MLFARVIAAQLTYQQDSEKHLAVLKDETSHEPSLVRNASSMSPLTATRKSTPMTETTSRSARFKPAVTRSKTSPVLPLSEHLRVQVSRYSSRSPSLTSSRLAHYSPSKIGVQQSGPFKRTKPKARAQYLHSNTHMSTSKDAETTELSAVDDTLRAKAKRSFRHIFHQRNPTVPSRPDSKHVPKRSSITGSALAQRFQDSTKLSNVSLTRPVVASPASNLSITVSSDSMEPSGERTGSCAVLSAPEPRLAKPHSFTEPATKYDTATVVHKILDRVTSLREESPDRLRGLEIAEVCLALRSYTALHCESVLTLSPCRPFCIPLNAPKRLA